MSKEEVIEKLENLLFKTKGDFEKTCESLQTAGLSEEDIGSCLEGITKEYNTLLQGAPWVCGITAEGGKMANAKIFNDVFKLDSEDLSYKIMHDQYNSYDQELFKKYKEEEVSHSEGEGVQFIREMKICAEILVTSLIRRFNGIYKFTSEESKNLKEYLTVARGVLSDNYSTADEYMHALSHLIRNSSLDVEKMFNLNNLVTVSTEKTALIDLLKSNTKLTLNDLKDKPYEDLSKLVSEKYKDSVPMPFPHKQAQKLEQVQSIQPLEGANTKELGN